MTPTMKPKKKTPLRYRLLRSVFGPAAVLALAGGLSGCHLDMWQQPRYEPLEKTDLGMFPDGLSSRPAPEGRVGYAPLERAWTAPVFAQLTNAGQLPDVLDEAFHTGKRNGELLDENYFPISKELIERGQERFTINCMPCHGALGDGQGYIPSRGFPNPPTYHQDRLREAGDGHLFDVMTNGFGRMYSREQMVLPEDRWAIAAYIRALQFSQNVDLAVLPDSARKHVEAGMAAQKQAEAEAAAAAEAAQNQSGDAHHGAH
jgi:hypothetical protein